jgi:hypothetical protein
LNGCKDTITDKPATSTDEEEFKRYALICDAWAETPQTIRYVASIKADAKSRDYLYLIGCDEPEFFTPADLIANIIQTHKENASLQRQANGRSVPSDIKDTVNSIEKTWNAVKYQTLPDSVKKHPLVGIAFNNRLLARTMHGVINFYNYLLHAHKHLNIVSLYEVDGDKLEKTVKILQLLKEYESVYKYCRNLTLHNYTTL